MSTLAAVKVTYLLVVLFTDSQQEASYQMQSLKACEQAKAPVAQLYKDLGSKVELSCKTVSKESGVEVRTSYRIKYTESVKLKY